MQENLEKKLEAANKTANQTISEGNENEVQGKLAVPTVEVVKRGYVKHTENNQLVKTLSEAEINAKTEEHPTPDYIVLHQQVLEGADPLEAQRSFKPSEEVIQEGDREDIEDSPRSGPTKAAAINKQTEETQENAK